jgi:EamA domain-containing membrane protein RarD
MQMQMNDAQQQLSARHRVMVILWVSMLASVGLYFVLSKFMTPPDGDGSQSRMVTFALTAMGVFLAITSFAIKHKFMAQAEATQSPALVQTGMITGLALCDAAALLGFLDYLTTGNRYYFVLFLIAVVGILFHFPRRDQIALASYRQQGQVNQNQGD